VLLSLAIGALQLRHSLAFGRGERPRGGLWTLLVLVALTYLPMLLFGFFGWHFAQAALIASAPMILRGRAGLAVASGVAVLSGVITAVVSPPSSTAQVLYNSVTNPLAIALLGAFLYASARLARVLNELHATRTELAELAIGRERLRVSRDLHDLLGQSLSAISLKGDLAIRLLPTDEQAARGEIESLTSVARHALRGVRAVARDEHTMSLSTEIDGARALLASAGITARIQNDLADLPPPVDTTLAWTVREGVTNVLRHSEAGTCWITASQRDGTLHVAIINDGARSPSGGGSGLAGLTERARALSGTVTAEHLADGRFRLVVRIPEARSARSVRATASTRFTSPATLAGSERSQPPTPPGTGTPPATVAAHNPEALELISSGRIRTCAHGCGGGRLWPEGPSGHRQERASDTVRRLRYVRSPAEAVADFGPTQRRDSRRRLAAGRQRTEQPVDRRRHIGDGGLERVVGRLRRLPQPAHLPDELAGRRLDLLVGRRRVEPTQLRDIATHASNARVTNPPAVASRPASAAESASASASSPTATATSTSR